MSKPARIPGMTKAQAARANVSMGRVARYHRRVQQPVRERDIDDAARSLDQRRDQALETEPESEEEA